MGKFIDLNGMKFGRLTVISRAENNGTRKVQWNCICECGKDTVTPGVHLRIGKTKSCGCLRDENIIKAITKHGMHNTSEYQIWCAVKHRCNNPKNKYFYNYGGRGITICESWSKSFENFYNDMGPRPSNKYSIDRKDVNGNYEPSNCKWATKEEQSINIRTRKNTISGVRGVAFNKRVNKYFSRINVKGKSIYLGYFDTVEMAALARKEAEEKYWGKSS